MEFEIFRQLQMQRQESIGTELTQQMINYPHQIVAPASVQHWPRPPTSVPWPSVPAQATPDAQMPQHIPKCVIDGVDKSQDATDYPEGQPQTVKKVCLDFCSAVNSDCNSTDTSGVICSGGCVENNLISHNIHQSQHKSSPALRKATPPHSPGEILRERCRDKEKDHTPLMSLQNFMSSGNASPQSSESERGHRRTDSSSGHSGAERQDTPRLGGGRLGSQESQNRNKHSDHLPPKPTFSHTKLAYIKSRQLHFRPDLAAAESSSGSEQEVFGVKRMSAAGRRNLRKTKSRGKGKGYEVEIESPMVLTADFPSDNKSAGSTINCDIVIHPVPLGVNLEDDSIPE